MRLANLASCGLALALSAMSLHVHAQTDPNAPPPIPMPPPPLPPAPPPPGAFTSPPQQEAPIFMPYSEGQPVPQGYRVVSKRRIDIAIVGIAIFGLAYGSTLYAAVIVSAADSNRKEGNRGEVLYVPFAGPLMFASKVNAKSDGYFWLASVSAAQIAGAVVAIVGFNSTESRLYRNDIVARVTPTPIITPGFQGLAWSGSF